MSTYPIEFSAVTTASSGLHSSWHSKAFEREELTMAIPKEFEGEGLGFSPEDLYVLALSNCFMATFKFAAAKSSLEFHHLELSSRLVVDLDENKRPVMKELYLVSKLHSPNNGEKAKRLLLKIESSCLILNSVKTKVYFQHEIID
jgi:organic hydroperoxide reductase OsmC/OhrA